LEKKALSDSFLAEALEGAEQISAADFSTDVNSLQKRIIEQKEKTFWTWPLRIAAGVAILLASTFVLWQAFNLEPETKQLALEQRKSKPHQPSLADSSVTKESATQPIETTTAGPTPKNKTDEIKPATKSKVGEASAQGEKQTQPIQQTEAKPETVVALSEETRTEARESMPVTAKEERVALAKDDADEDNAKLDQAEEVQPTQKLVTSRDKRKKSAPVSAERASGGSTSGQKVIRGRVTSTEDGSALPGVNVVINGSTIGTVTDESGNYQIESGGGEATLVYSFIGLESKEVATGDRSVVDVSLSLDVTQLSEVVVTAFGVSQNSSITFTKIPTVDLAHPTDGYPSFKQYLQQSLRYPEQAQGNKVEGRVTVEFTVEPNGNLTDFKVIRGIGYGCEEELIRLIKEGVRWLPTTIEGTAVQDKARVRLKFELPK
jgi:TonB family protein